MTPRRTTPGPAHPQPASAAIVGYYSHKTQEIIDKYGPGPRVHYHSGWYETPGTPWPQDIETLRQSLIAAQERTLTEATKRWEKLCPFAGGRILDIGCGLGGAALFLAETYGCTVTAITPVPEHAEIITGFARQANVSDQVSAVVGDAHWDTYGPPGSFDAAFSFESSCYFDRPKWFASLSTLLKDGAGVFIEDYFAGPNKQWKTPFDDHYKCDIGTPQEYHSAATAAGFTLLEDENVSHHVQDFWIWSSVWNRKSAELPGADRAHLTAWTRRHEQWSAAWNADAIQIRLLAYRYNPPSPS